MTCCVWSSGNQWGHCGQDGGVGGNWHCHHGRHIIDIHATTGGFSVSSVSDGGSCDGCGGAGGGNIC